MFGAFLVGGDWSFALGARVGQLVRDHFVRAADWPFVVASGIALLAGLLGRRHGHRAIALFVVAYAFMLSTGTNFFMRWLNPILPALCVLVGSVVERVTARLRLGSAGCALATAAIAALPLARAVGIDRLFLRETTFQKTVRALREAVPADAAVACAHRHVARVIDRSERFVAWDPFGLAARSEWYAVVPHHPIDGIGTDPCMASVVLPAMGDVTTVAEFTGLKPSRWGEVEYEDSDFFFYPVRGFAAVEAPGPGFRILRISRRPESSSKPAPPPPTLSIAVLESTIRLSFVPPPGVEVLAYYLRWAPESGAQAGVFFGPFAVPPGSAEIPYSKAISHGRFVVSCATIVRGGVGPWSDPVTIAFE
jgi:4-amino-4-deoxy-L-arabinose transferase-like glycosyltransferase